MSTRRNSNERYLVIGGAGFLGSYIVQALVDRGEVDVAVFGGAKPIHNELIGGVSYFPGDITNEKELRDCLEKVSLKIYPPHHVSHLCCLCT
jgi:sterol-4alpha-carboxylate 3-dehydrogenase (decarboxylating)